MFPKTIARRGARPGLVLAAVCALIVPANAQTTAAPAVPEKLTENLAWQIALDGNGYSPGALDGVTGAKTRYAIAAVEIALGRPPSGRKSAELAKLIGVRADSATVPHRITDEDERTVGVTGATWIQKSRQKWLPYTSLLDAIAESYHTSAKCLGKLNPGADLAKLRVGDTVLVPNRTPISKRPRPAVDRIEIDLERRLALLIREDAAGNRYLQGLLHCSIAREPARAPVGSLRVLEITHHPEYTFDPKAWPEIKDVTRRLRIPPGPRSPVGTHWIQLDRSGYGIHGTPHPENIGKTGSHGCFRLTNWDVDWLATVIRRGMSVEVVGKPSATSWSWVARR